MRATALFTLLVILSGCGLAMDAASLQANGYVRSSTTFITATGERRENQRYEV